MGPGDPDAARPAVPASRLYQAAAFSPDGKTLLTGCEDGAARLWDLKTRQLRTAPLLHQLWIFAVAFSPDGKTVLTGSKDKTARLWDAATGMSLGPPSPKQTRSRRSGQVYTVAFSPDGDSFLTGDFGSGRGSSGKSRNCPTTWNESPLGRRSLPA